MSYSLIETTSASEVLEHLRKATEHDLVILDVDEVLITPKDRFLRPSADSQCTPLFREIFYPMNSQLYGEWISQVKVEPVNQAFLDGVCKLQQRNIKVIALTRMIPGAGPCGKILSMEDFRFHELQAVGIDFSRSLEETSVSLDFPPLENRQPLFSKGILYAKPYTKAEVLAHFLSKIAFKPKRIWFVDNDKRYVEEVGEAMRLPFVGIHYLDEKFGQETFDLEWGITQFHHFQKTGVWLSDN